MARLQLRNLDIGFSPSMDYESHWCAPLKASTQFASTALFIFLIPLTLGTHRKTLWDFNCHISLPTRNEFYNAFSPHPYFTSFFSFLHLPSSNTVYHYLFILLIVSLSPFYVNSTKAGHFICAIHCCISASENYAWHIVGAQ